MNAIVADPRARRMDGFTLIELVTVIVLVGILAVVALPRFAEVSVFESHGFRQETLSLLRWAQKSAVAQRRTVCVAVNAGGVALTVDTDTPPDGACNGAGSLALPSAPRGGGVLAGAGFNFLASGATSGSGTITLTVAGADDIRIDAVTGYVR